MPDELSPERIKSNKAALKGERQNFDDYYQTLHDYFYVEAQDVNTQRTPGTELDFLQLMDSTSLELADILASGIDNFLTPQASKWFALEHPDKALRDNKNVRQWMQDTADEILFIFSRSNFYQQTPQFYKSSGVYGTSILMLEEDIDDSLRFYNLPIKSTFIAEDARERVNQIYMDFQYNAEQAINKFGIDKVDKDIIESIKDGKKPNKMFNYTFYLGPREIREYGSDLNTEMPIRGVWVEDKTSKVMKEDGFRNMPAVAHRFYKRPRVPYGYSPAMKALPWIRMLNTMADTILRSAMKQTDPPIALPDSGFLAPMNFNPRAQNFYKKTKIDPAKDIFPLGNFGDPRVGQAELEYYAERASQMMFKNAFINFQGLDKQMTATEVTQRANEQLTMLGPAVGRFMSDVLQPLIERSIGILFKAGRLPPLPEELQLNPQFDVKFIGRLALAQKQSEVNNMTNALQIAGQIAQFKPEALDKINADATIDELWSVTNAPAEMIFDKDEVAEIRKAKAEQQQLLQSLELAQMAASAGKDASQVDKNLSEVSNNA